jgi:dTDP-glucose 4,6-dehydratase/UDP-glucose 4-epimerase
VEIVFLAALIAIPYSYVAAESYIETNVRGTLNALEAARRAGVARFIQTSTSEVYGTPSELPIRETHPLQAQSPYAASKVGADQLALAFQHSHGLPVAVLRPSTPMGLASRTGRCCRRCFGSSWPDRIGSPVVWTPGVT